MRYSDGTLEQVRSRIDIVELVREYVPGLKRAGRHFKACCPFHTEKTPSFLVNPDKQIFHCFGCQEGGDAFKFLMKMENLSFPEAVQELAGRAGVTLESTGSALSGKDKEKLDLRKALEFAVEFYAQTLRGPKGAAARQYLDRRKIAPESREAFQIGWAPGDGQSFLEAAVNKGLPPQLLEKAGLAGYQDQRGRYYDYFRDRVLFPIYSAKGEILGFGGRVLDDREPKYLNSPDTPLFSKGKVLYGLRQAAPAIRQARRVIVLEGYTDVIACHAFGFANAVAPLGTALTLDHAAAFKRLCEEAILLFDPDSAGVAASLRGAELLMEAEIGVRVASMPEGMDPDEFLEKEGAEAFKARLEAAVDIAEFKTAVVLEALPEDASLSQTVKAAGSVLETIAKQPNLVLRREWVKRLGERTGLDPESLSAEMARKAPKVPARAKVVAPEKPSAPKLVVRLPPGDEELIRFYLLNPAWIFKEPQPVAEDFRDSRSIQVLEVLRNLASSGTANVIVSLSEKMPEDSVMLRELAMNDERPAPQPDDFLKFLDNLRQSRKRDRFKALQIKDKEQGLSFEELVEYRDLSRVVKGSPIRITK